MKRLRVAPLAVTAALVVVWCGGSSAGALTVGSSKPKPPRRCADAAKLGDAVLTVSEMPTGFGEVPGIKPENAVRLGGGNISSSSIPFPTIGNTLRGFQLVSGPYVADTAILLQNAKDAPKVLKAFRDAAAAAATWEQTISDPRPGTETYTATALSFPKIGDETFSVRLALKFRDAQFGTEINQGTADYVVWRHGPIVSVVLGHNLDTLTYVKKVDAKVSKILKPCPKKKAKK
jgi:hypothetical protein